jgi:hypothetical protein
LQLGGQRVRAFLFFPHEIVAQFDHGRNVSFGDFCITLLVSSNPRGAAVAAPVDDETRSQLISDFESFARNFEHEEQARLTAEAAERARKEQELRNWTALPPEVALEVAAQHKAGAPVAAATDPGASSARRAALEMLRKRAAEQGPKENPAITKARMIDELDKSLRAGFHYLAELVKELNEVMPVSGKPYEYLYLGTLPSVSIHDGFVDSRPLHIPGRDVTERVIVRYKISLSSPAKVSVIGAPDIKRAIDFFKGIRADHKAQAEARDDFGKVTKALFTVQGVLPCELVVRGDYENPGIVVDLHNVRKLGRVECRMSAQEFDDSVDDLARWVLGADDDFEKFLKRK